MERRYVATFIDVNQGSLGGYETTIPDWMLEEIERSQGPVHIWPYADFNGILDRMREIEIRLEIELQEGEWEALDNPYL